MRTTCLILFLINLLCQSGHADSRFKKTFVIQKSCVEKFGPNLSEQLTKASMVGLDCIAGLSNKINGASKNFKSLNHFLTSNQITLTCNNYDYFDKTGSTAHASIPGYHSKASHPLIEINPRLELKDITLLQPLIFHELLHFVTKGHGDGIDFSYACETCCFDKDEGLKKRIACEICRGNFLGPQDPRYLKYLLQYVPLSFQSRSRFHLGLFGRRILIKIKSSIPHLILLIEGRSDYDLVGIMWAKFLLTKKIVSSGAWLNLAETEIPPESNPSISLVNQIIGFMNSLYLKGDLLQAANLYAKLDLSILKELNAKKNMDIHKWYILEDLKRYLELDYQILESELAKRDHTNELSMIKIKYSEYQNSIL